MVVTLVLTGFSYRANLYELASHLNSLLNANDIGTCEMRTLPNHHKTNKRQIGLDFESGFEAMPAQDLLNGYDYETSDGVVYKIKAKISSPESAMALDSIEEFERDVYKFSMSDLLKRPKVHNSIENDTRRKRKSLMIKYESSSESEDDMKRKHRHSPEPSTSIVKKSKRVIKETEECPRYKSPSPSHSKKKKLKKSKKSSKLKDSKSALKRKEEKKLEKLKKKKRKVSSESVSEKNSDASDIELKKHRKRAKKKKKSEHNYNSDLEREYKMLQKRKKKMKKVKSKRSESPGPKETDTFKAKLISEDIKTNNNRMMDSDDIYVWSDDSCDTHVNSKNTNQKPGLFTGQNTNIMNSKVLEKRSKSLERHNSIGEATSSCGRDSSVKNFKHTGNKSEKKTFTNSSEKRIHSHEPFDSIATDKQSLEELSSIITLTYDEFEKETNTTVIKSEPNDEFENKEIDSKPEFTAKSTVIKSEPKDVIKNEEIDSDLPFSANSIIIKTEPIDELENEKISPEVPFSTKCIVIKSEPTDELKIKEVDLEFKSHINQNSTISNTNVDYDSESTLELEVENGSVPSCNQEDSAKLVKPKEDELKIWNALDEVLQDIPLDIF